MKKFFVLAFVIMNSLVGLCQTNNTRSVTTRQYELHQPAASVVVYDNVSVVFIDNLDTEVFVEGPAGIIKNVTVSIRGNEIVISNESVITGYRPIVYLSPRRLQTIAIHGNARVGNYGILDNERIDVYIGGDCELVMRTNGALNVSCEDGYAYARKDKKINR
jgi:hypothetical protein